MTQEIRLREKYRAHSSAKKTKGRSGGNNNPSAGKGNARPTGIRKRPRRRYDNR